jgi:hypothetical protein
LTRTVEMAVAPLKSGSMKLVDTIFIILL